MSTSSDDFALNSDRSAYDQVVRQLLEQLNLGRGFDELFDSIYDRLHGIVPYNRIAVALLDEPAHLLRLTSCRCDGEMQLKPGYVASIEGSTLEPLLRTGHPRILNSLTAYLADNPKSESTALIVKEGMRSNLTLPLVADGKPIGVVFFSSRRFNAYTEQHATLLKSLASHIAISIERAQLIAQLQERNQELTAASNVKDQFLDRLRQEVQKQTIELRQSEQRYRLLVKLGRIINSSLELKEVFQHAAGELHKLIECDRVSLILIQSGANVRHGFGLEFGRPDRWVDIPTLALAGSAAEWVMQRRIPRVVRCLATDRQFPEDERLFEQGYGAYVHLPLVCRGSGIGIMGIATREAQRLEFWDLELLGELADQLATALDNATAYSEIERLKLQLEQQNIYLRDEIKTNNDFESIVGGSQAIREVRQAIKQVATTDSTVLVLGETGTGKELVARAVHEFSSRKNELLVKINCAALAPSLIASELFGHEAGAFTGAAKRRYGRFEIAQNGTIFLDEIAELPQETQVMLLRVLQERVIERVGDSNPIQVNVRVIAATNRDLKHQVDQGQFRADLFYRLNVFPIHVPPLRARREDIPSLLNHFIGRFSRRMDKTITRVNRRTMELLMNYAWPGNVRELENIIERAMIVSTSDTLEIDATWLVRDAEPPRPTGNDIRPLAEVERQTIVDALQRCNGKVYGPDGAAGCLGLKPTTLYGKMRKLGIQKQAKLE